MKPQRQQHFVTFVMLFQMAVMLFMVYAISLQGEKIKEWRGKYEQEASVRRVEQMQHAETAAALRCAAGGYQLSRLEFTYFGNDDRVIAYQCSHDGVQWTGMG